MKMKMKRKCFKNLHPKWLESFDRLPDMKMKAWKNMIRIPNIDDGNFWWNTCRYVQVFEVWYFKPLEVLGNVTLSDSQNLTFWFDDWDGFRAIKF